MEELLWPPKASLATWPWVPTSFEKLGEVIILRGLQLRIRKAMQARHCLHVAGPNKLHSAGPQAGPVAADSYKATWSMSLLKLSEPGQMFIQELRETGFGSQRVAERTHSLTFHSAAFLASRHSLCSQGLPICGRECPDTRPCPHPQSQSWEEWSAQSVGLCQVSWPLSFFLRTRAMWCSGGFLVLVLEKETVVGSL